MGRIDLSTTLCGVRLPNPTVLASGVLGLSHEILVRVAEAGAGAVTTKSCSLPLASSCNWSPTATSTRRMKTWPYTLWWPFSTVLPL